MCVKVTSTDLLAGSVQDIEDGYFVIDDALFPIRVLNRRVILLHKMTLCVCN